ncbi:MAG TPA: response regulator [Sandaracinaceae bacterium LLY-WYZ-13_1]|nr:response regulator [Sandaracinaceae bacterium LLY-WYZ-13_1]
MADPDAPLPRILVVEDDPDARKMIAHMLRRMAQVIEAENGEEALELAVERRPDLIVTDVMMPRLDGFELTRTLKSDAGLRSVPVVLVTARGTAKDVVEGINAGARHYLVKPFTPDELLRKVRKALRRAR